MIKIIILFTIVTSAFATSRPRITNFGRFVEVAVDNYTDKDLSCSGSLYLVLEDGRTQYEFFSESVRANGNTRRTYYAWDYSNQIRTVSDSISCY